MMPIIDHLLLENHLINTVGITDSVLARKIVRYDNGRFVNIPIRHCRCREYLN